MQFKKKCNAFDLLPTPSLSPIHKINYHHMKLPKNLRWLTLALISFISSYCQLLPNVFLTLSP